jgi:formylglycine-generating enzyme required for sulfatase activity
MIGRFIAALQQSGLLLSDEKIAALSEAHSLLNDEDIADAIWLAAKIGGAYQQFEPAEEATPNTEALGTEVEIIGGSTFPPSEQPIVPVTMPEPIKQEAQTKETPENCLPIQVKAPPALSDTRAIRRSLRPFMRKVPSLTRSVLDETATVDYIANHKIWLPILKPSSERWFDLELVIEANQFSFIWKETLDEFRQLLEIQGSFRNVRTWYVVEHNGIPKLTNKRQTSELAFPSRSPKELIDPSGRRLVLFVSDCRSQLWKEGKIHDWLTLWSQHEPLAVVQLLSERLWSKTELDAGYAVQVGSFIPGALNQNLQVRELPTLVHDAPIETLTLPIVTLSASALKQWALVVAAAGRQRCPARLFDLSWVRDTERERSDTSIRAKSPEARIELFNATASPLAQRLAGMMAAVPVELPVVHLIQQELLRHGVKVEPVHIAEVYTSSLLESVNSEQSLVGDLVQYKFVDGVRRLLNKATSTYETLDVIEALSRKIAESLGFSITSFTALLLPKFDWEDKTQESILPFAQIVTEVLHNLGGRYAEFATRVERDAQQYPNWLKPPEIVETEEELSWENFPLLEDFDFQTAQFVDPEDPPSFPPPLKIKEFTVATISTERNIFEPFDFTIATIGLRISKNIFGRDEQKWVIQRQQSSANKFIESLAEKVSLEMVAIPGGSFLMGSPDDEPESFSSERPQHEVTVEPFFMGRYPITQAQWKAVARMPQVDRQLKANPSNFKGDNRPVESISWDDALEFCKRLTNYTKRQYRLPSEAEWEYACRAGTTTPFHFGEMVTTELANYNGRSYNNGPKGKSLGKTTPVDQFKIANAFGLNDTHGNVWEWCADHWHDNYEGAPSDGSASLKEDKEEKYVLRGGSWLDPPRGCRSAFRLRYARDVMDFNVGFRVCCSLPRTQ